MSPGISAHFFDFSLGQTARGFDTDRLFLTRRLILRRNV